MNGQKGVVILIVAMLLTAGIGFFLNVSQKDVTKVAYNKITDLEGIIGENAGDVSSYSSYSPTSNVTGWYGNKAVIPYMDEGSTSPYIVAPRGANYTYSNYTCNMRSFTYITGEMQVSGDFPTSTTKWSTNKPGVTYDSYPVTGDASTDSETTWVKYSDGGMIHGGVSKSFTQSSLGIGGYVVQSDVINFYISDRPNVASITIFAPISEILGKVGVELQNNYRISFTGDVLYDCKLYADKSVNHVYRDNGSILQTYTTSNIYLTGEKNTASSIKYMNGSYVGLDSNGIAIWSSANVYIYSTKSNITVTVGVPDITNPLYVDPYTAVTIKDSGYTLEPTTNSYDFDWAGYPMTTAGIVQNDQFTIDKDIAVYISDIEYAPNTYGDINATYSNGATESLEDSFTSAYLDGVWGYKPGAFNFTWDGSNRTVEAKYVVGPTDIDYASDGYVYYMFTGDLIGKFVPNPLEGDVVSFDTMAGVNDAVMIRPTDSDSALGFVINWAWKMQIQGPIINRAYIADFHTDVSVYQRDVQLSDVYFQYTNGVWVPYNKITHEAYEYSEVSDDVESESPNTKSMSISRPGNLLIVHSAESDGMPAMELTMNYVRNTVQFATTSPDISFGDFDGITLSDGSPLYGGISTDYIPLSAPVDGVSEVRLIYNLSGIREHLAWANLRDVILGLDSQVLVTATTISINGGAGAVLYQNLGVNCEISNPTPTKADYTITLTGVPIACDYLEYNTLGYWVAKSGDTTVWSGQLSDLTLVTTSSSNIAFSIVTEGYAWSTSPTVDSNVVYWSNGADNPTIVNGQVSLLLIPTGSTQSNIQIFTGDVLYLTATPQDAGYKFVYTLDESAPVDVGVYKGLYITYSITDDTITIAGLTSLVNTVAYTVSPIVFNSALLNTQSLKFIYFLAFDADWGSYITETQIENDPLGLLWGGFNVNLNNYLSTQLPGVRVAINGVVAYGTSLTINGVELPVSDGKITFQDKKYVLKGSAIDYTAENHTYLRISEGTRATLDLGETKSYVFAGEGSWYFATSAYAISNESTQEYQWTPGWELNWNQALVVFIIVMVGACIVCRRLEMLDMEFMDWAVIIGAIIICGGLISSGGI